MKNTIHISVVMTLLASSPALAQKAYVNCTEVEMKVMKFESVQTSEGALVKKGDLFQKTSPAPSARYSSDSFQNIVGDEIAALDQIDFHITSAHGEESSCENCFLESHISSAEICNLSKARAKGLIVPGDVYWVTRASVVESESGDSEMQNYTGETNKNHYDSINYDDLVQKFNTYRKNYEKPLFFGFCHYACDSIPPSLEAKK